MYYLVNKENHSQIRICPILFHFTWLCSLIQRDWIVPIIKVIYFSILRPMKNNVRFEYFPQKNVWFCFSSIVWVQFSHNTGKFWFWKSLKYLNFFYKERYGVRFEYVPWKNVWFCFIFIVRVYLVNLNGH